MAGLTETEWTALQVANAAAVTPDGSYDLLSTVVRALGSAQLLQSPVTAAEHERVRSERGQFADRVDTLTKVAKGNKRHVQELYAELQKEKAEREADRRTWQHDLGQLREAHDEAARLRDALTAVRGVHARDEDADYCTVCSNHGDVQWPCRTVVAAGAAPAAPELTVYRAQHDSIVLDLYDNRDAARAHCEAYLRREVGDTVPLQWVPDYSGEVVVEELSYIGASDDDPAMDLTGYVVTPLTVASRFDEEADQ